MTASKPLDELVNLDYAASAPLRPEALAAMAAYDASPYAGANPNSLHSLGRAAAAALEGARRDVARSLGRRVRPSEVVFTGGGTEANVIALEGMALGARGRDSRRSRVIVSALEHDSILDNVPALKRAGFVVDVLDATSAGTVSLERLEALMGADVALVSVMLANNETGAVQPLRDVVRIAHAAGALVHTDAIQGYLHVPFDPAELGVDAASMAGHKVGAPASIGALYVRSRTPLVPLSHGGGQELGIRPGTQDVRSALAFAAVARALAPRVADAQDAVRARSDEMYRRLLASPRIEATLPDPYAQVRLPGIVSITVAGLESEELILRLDAAGFEVSAASACSSGSLDASHVLTAMGIPRDRALGSLRVSFDDRVPADALGRFCDALLEIAGA